MRPSGSLASLLSSAFHIRQRLRRRGPILACVTAMPFRGLLEGVWSACGGVWNRKGSGRLLEVMESFVAGKLSEGKGLGRIVAGLWEASSRLRAMRH